MSPGPKKPSGSRKGGNIKEKCDKTHKPVSNMSVDSVSEKDEITNEEHTTANSKYKKRQILSNSSRYEEPVEDHLASLDAQRGGDYETLLSYSSGAGTQYRFLDEKEWETSNDEIMNLTFNLNDLSESMKCIPFYKRLELPENLFEQSQLLQMNRAAEQNKISYTNKIRPGNYPVTKPNITPEFTFKPHTENIIQLEKCSEPMETPKVSEKISLLPKNTEQLIESLASSLALKSTTTELPTAKSESLELTANDKTSDGLDFLLSLSVGSTASTKNNTVKSKITDSKVDEWLSSILDE